MKPLPAHLPRLPRGLRLAAAAVLGAALLLALLPGAGRAQAPAGAKTAPAAGEGEVEQRLRKGLAERLPGLPPIDEIRPTPVPGLYEVRIGAELVYSDAQGAHVLQGSLIETKTRRNLTEERLQKINQVDFASLPLKDAVVWKTGNGKRRIAVFSDPRCSYCKRFETELSKARDLTVYTFLLPVLGEESLTLAKSIWCAKDSTATWRGWMVDGQSPPKGPGATDCAHPIERNLELGERLRVRGTPVIVFEDGSRAPGFIPAAELEKRLGALAGKGG